MKKKDLQALAKKIAKAELCIQNSLDENEVQRAKEDIMKYTSHVTDWQDLDLLDEMIQEILQNA